MFLSGVPAGTNLYGAADTLTVISSEQLLHLSAAFKQSSLEALGGLCPGRGDAETAGAEGGAAAAREGLKQVLGTGSTELGLTPAACKHGSKQGERSTRSKLGRDKENELF